MAGHAVVVIEEAVADENFGLREIGAKGRNCRFDLRQRRGRRDRDTAGRCQHNHENSAQNTRHIRSPCLGFILWQPITTRGFVAPFGIGRAPGWPRTSLCTRPTKGYLPEWAIRRSSAANLRS